MLPRIMGVFIWIFVSGFSGPKNLMWSGLDRCRSPGLVTFTFDDGVSKNYKELLDILDVERIKATFFIEAETTLIQRNFAMLKDAFKRGHEIGNHTWSHPNLTKINDIKFEREIGSAENAILIATGLKPKYFRPPFGSIDDNLNQRLIDRGYTVVFWNVDSHDWDFHRSKARMWRVYERAFDKSDPSKQSFILLLHDKRRDSVEMVPAIAKLVRSRGFKIVSLTECLRG